MSSPLWWGDWRPTLTPHTGNLQPTDLIECTMMSGGVPTNTVITGQQIIDGAGGGGGAAGYYAQYQDDISQPLGAVNVGQPTKFRTMDLSNGVTVNSDTEITFANTGIYNLQFSFQFQNLDVKEHDVTIWLRKNGTDVDGSAGFVAVVASHGGTPGHCIPSWNYLLNVVGGDFYELYWSATSLDVTMEYYPAGSPPPATASAIFTVTQQAGIIAGTGMTALNGLSADVQTISTGTTGTNFNVVSSGTDHQFNLPTASATTRGALSTTDWSAFNGKQAALVSGTNIKTINNTSLLGSGNINIQPKLLGYSGTTGLTNSGISITVSKSLLIPANTITTDCIMDIKWRLFRVLGNVGQMYTRLYINTANNLTGATLLSGAITINGGGTQYAITAEKSISCSSSTLKWMNSALASEASASNLSTTVINRAVDQYLLFTVQVQTTGESACVDLYRVSLYA